MLINQIPVNFYCFASDCKKQLMKNTQSIKLWFTFSTVVLVLLSPFAVAQNINPQLTSSRTSGAAPLAVFFAGTGTTCGGNCNAFHDLFYEWEFGDPQSGNWSITGKPKNTAFGPTTAHVFDRPGNYTVRMTVTSAGGTQVSRTVTINVQNPDTVWAGIKTKCFSSGNNFNGCPAGAEHINSNSLTTASNNCGGGSRCLFRGGETFNGSFRLSGSNAMVASYGNGKAKFSTQGKAFDIDGGASDWRMMDIEVVGNSTKETSVLSSRGRPTRILIYKTSAVPGTLHSGVGLSGTLYDSRDEDIADEIYVVENTWRDFGFGSGGNIGFIAAGHLAILGNFLEDSTGGEHIIRVQHGEVGVVSHNNFGRQAVTKGLLSLRSRDQNDSCSAGCGRAAREFTVSDNIFRGASDGGGVSVVGQNKSTETSRGRDFLIERNFFMQHPQASGAVQLAVNTQNDLTNVTVRNNIVVMKDWLSYRGLDLRGGVNVRAYNNSCYTPDNPSLEVRCVRGADSTYNNLLYAPNADNKVVVTDSDLGGNILASSNPFIINNPNVPEDFVLRNNSEAAGAATNQAPINPVDFFLGRIAGLTAIDAGAIQLDAGAPPPPPPPPEGTDLAIAKLVAYRVDTDEIIYDPFVGGVEQPLSLDPGFALCAEVDGNDPVGSVKFILEGLSTGTEQIFPYCQNDENGDFRQYEEITAVGTYFLNSVTPYTGANATGVAGIALENIELVVIPTQSLRIPKPPQLLSVDP